MQIKSRLSRFDTKVYGLHFPLPDDVKSVVEGFDNNRVIFSVNQLEGRRGAIMKSADYHYVLVNQGDVNKLNLQLGDEAILIFAKDESEYGMDMPEEFLMVMAQNEQAFKYFQELTPGKQRNLIYIAGQVKNSDKRINKALAIAEHLEEGNGLLDFKKLNITIKKYNNRDKR